MKPLQYAHNLFAKSCKVAHAHEGPIQNKISIEGDDCSICDRLHDYLATKPQANVTNIEFKVQLFLKNKNDTTREKTNF